MTDSIIPEIKKDLLAINRCSIRRLTLNRASCWLKDSPNIVIWASICLKAHRSIKGSQENIQWNLWFSNWQLISRLRLLSFRIEDWHSNDHTRIQISIVAQFNLLHLERQSKIKTTWKEHTKNEFPLGTRIVSPAIGEATSLSASLSIRVCIKLRATQYKSSTASYPWSFRVWMDVS